MPHRSFLTRIEALHRRFDLSDKAVLEIGCFEGVHTAALCRFALTVTAVDARIENVVKTIVRTAMFGYRQVFACNVEDPEQASRLPDVDVVHHMGVLYHLADPIQHLRAVGGLARTVVMLDTHVALPEQATEAFESGGRKVRYHRVRESGRADVFSGVNPHSKWLLLDDIIELLQEAGLSVEAVERRMERNGARVLLYAIRKSRAQDS